MKEKKSNRAVPYLYYEVEKKRNSKLLPPNENVPQCSCYETCSRMLLGVSLDFETALFFMDVFDPGFDQFLSGFQQKYEKVQFELKISLNIFFTITSLEEVPIVKV